MSVCNEGSKYTFPLQEKPKPQKAKKKAKPVPLGPTSVEKAPQIAEVINACFIVPHKYTMEPVNTDSVKYVLSKDSQDFIRGGGGVQLYGSQKSYLFS